MESEAVSLNIDSGKHAFDHKFNHKGLDTAENRQDFMKHVVEGLEEAKKASDTYLTQQINNGQKQS